VPLAIHFMTAAQKWNRVARARQTALQQALQQPQESQDRESCRGDVAPKMKTPILSSSDCMMIPGEFAQRMLPRSVDAGN